GQTASPQRNIQPYKPSRFLIFLLFFRIEEKGLGGLGTGMRAWVTEEKRSRTRRISLKFI
ncbi:hypothetical protein, partial [Desulfotomaculum sp. OF05-3]|uniref:hypothetical protein n=1 Tax=Desulfotomaculum sp. OF05-3 TaxID=2305243 RepID=UPI000E875260